MMWFYLFLGIVLLIAATWHSKNTPKRWRYRIVDGITLLQGGAFTQAFLCNLYWIPGTAIWCMFKSYSVAGIALTYIVYVKLKSIGYKLPKINITFFK